MGVRVKLGREGERGRQREREGGLYVKQKAGVTGNLVQGFRCPGCRDASHAVSFAWHGVRGKRHGVRGVLARGSQRRGVPRCRRHLHSGLKVTSFMIEGYKTPDSGFASRAVTAICKQPGRLTRLVRAC